MRIRAGAHPDRLLASEDPVNFLRLSPVAAFPTREEEFVCP
jgi:hypothetical protein